MSRELIIQAAKSVAEVKHKGQLYGQKYPYTKHLKDVSDVLTRFGVNDPEMHAAAWLHDTVEDTDLTLEQVKMLFGDRVTDLVYRVTNEIGKNRKERHEKTYIKTRQSSDAVQLKLADRIANVEQSVSDSQKDMLKMYKKEHVDFKRLLYAKGVHEPMWRHLNFLIGDTSGE